MEKKIEANFLQFLSGMSAQTLMHLGVLENPLTKQATIDLVNAKYSIDLLEIIQEKTKGNLNEEEEAYLKSSLHDLRTRYLAVSEK